MKKCFSLFAIYIFFIFIANSKTILEKQDKLNEYWPNRDPDYKLVITCEDDSVLELNSIFFIKTGKKITIDYDPAKVDGGGQGGSIVAKTELRISKSGLPFNYTEPFFIEKDQLYVIELFEQVITDGNKTKYNKLITTRIAGVDEIFTDCIKNYSGYLLYFSTEFEDHNGGDANYSLSVKCNNATAKLGSNGIWYVKSNEKITIDYIPYYLSWGRGDKDGSEGGSEYSQLSINGNLESNTSNGQKKSITEPVEKDYEIKLSFIANDEEDSRSDVNILIKVDNKSPDEPVIMGINSGWVNEIYEIRATGGKDDVSGFSHFEYKENNDEYWTRKDSYVETIENVIKNGGTLNKEIQFRAVDYVGHVSKEVKVPVKIDMSVPVIKPTSSPENWTNENINIEATDTGSGLKILNIEKDGKPYIPQTENILSETGIYTVTAVDNAGNISNEVTYKIDKQTPVLNLNGYTPESWTNKDVTIQVTDNHSGIKSVTNNKSTVSNYSDFTIDATGKYEIIAEDNVNNKKTVTVKIDKESPVIKDPLNFINFSYEKKDGTEYLDSFGINYIVTEMNSGINTNQLLRKDMDSDQESVIIENNEIELTYKENIENFQRTKRDETLTYIVRVTDNAGNTLPEEKAACLTIPRKIILKIVERDDDNLDIRKSYIKDGYTINGIFINKINFDQYKEIRLNRTFLGDKPEDQDRKAFGYEEYKNRFDSTVSEEEIKRNWEECVKAVIKETDVKSVTVGGEEYWYYEDKIKTESGLGHRGIRYQAEWDWDLLDVTEKGEYVTIGKTANNPGRVKLRLQGCNSEGNEIRYMVFDSQGNKIEEESDADFTVPLNGVVRAAIKVEDEDFDDYDIEATELVKAVFMKDTQKTEETLKVVMEGVIAKGYIEKSKENENLKSQLRLRSESTDGWHEFVNPEIKLYYNKTFNMKITMTEGCCGKNGEYKDVTESGVIRLKAGTPVLGGFKLFVGEEAGYNEDGITARPHQKLELGVEITDASENGSSKTEWDFGDGKQGAGVSVTHTYIQSPARKGNTSEYKLSITVASGQTKRSATVSVHIIDTQYGMLLGDEEWIGVHPVLGRIQIPENVTLTISDNNNDQGNSTVILGYGSVLEDCKGVIEVLKDGRLCVDTQGVKITEGKNESTYMEVKTEKDDGHDESLKWGGIVIRSGAKECNIANAEIRYAENGIIVEKGSHLNVENLQVNNCSYYGLKADGEIKAVSILIEGVNNGVYISKEGIVSIEKQLKVLNGEIGISCDGVLKAGQIELDEISLKGLSIKGKTEIKNSIILTGNGKCGIENFQGSVLTSGTDLKVKGFEEGILNKGIITVGEDVIVEESLKNGIKNEGVITAESLKIKTLYGRGYICGSSSTTKFNQTKIEADEIGIHCTGTSEAEFGNSEIRAVTYGIKTDRDKEGSPYIKLGKDSYLEGALVLWYDLEGGVLTEDEIEEKILSE